MRLTAKDIYNKTFRRAFKGYDNGEVDEFLDLIIKDFVDMSEEIARLKSEVEKLQSEREALRAEYDKLEEQREDLAAKAAEQQESVKAQAAAQEEKALQTLYAAQKTADILISEAKDQAEAIVKTAEDKAARIDGVYYVQLAKQKKNIALIRSLVDQSRSEYRAVMEKNQRQFEEKSTEILASIDEFDACELDVPAQEFIPAAVQPEAEAKEQPAQPPVEEQHVLSEPKTEVPQADAVNEVQKYKSQYSDYSWLYEDENSEVIDVQLPRTSPEEEEHIKKLIDEISE